MYDLERFYGTKVSFYKGTDSYKSYKLALSQTHTGSVHCLLYDMSSSAGYTCVDKTSGTPGLLAQIFVHPAVLSLAAGKQWMIVLLHQELLCPHQSPVGQKA